MTISEDRKLSLWERLKRSLRRSGERESATIDYDALAGVEHHGRVVVRVGREGQRTPKEFNSVRDAVAWFGRAQTGLLARREELAHPVELARLGETLNELSSRPWATRDHLSALLLTSLGDAAVNSATLERSSQGVDLRARRFGRLHLCGSIRSEAADMVLKGLTWHLHGAKSRVVTLEGRFPGPKLHATLTLRPSGLQLSPRVPSTTSADLSGWTREPEMLARLRELLSKESGLILIAGRSDSGKSSLAELFEGEAEVLRRRRMDPVVMDEIDDVTGSHEALKRAESTLVIATIRAQGAEEALMWLRSVGVRRGRLLSTLIGAIEPQLLPVQCARCGGEGCQACHHSGLSHRRTAIAIAQTSSALREHDTLPPFERERRKLTA